MLWPQPNPECRDAGDIGTRAIEVRDKPECHRIRADLKTIGTVAVAALAAVAAGTPAVTITLT
jgi:hypothetical protein